MQKKRRQGLGYIIEGSIPEDDRCKGGPRFPDEVATPKHRATLAPEDPRSGTAIWQNTRRAPRD